LLGPLRGRSCSLRGEVGVFAGAFRPIGAVGRLYSSLL